MKVFIISSEDGEKTIVVVVCEMSDLFRIKNRGGPNHDRQIRISPIMDKRTDDLKKINM